LSAMRQPHRTTCAVCKNVRMAVDVELDLDLLRSLRQLRPHKVIVLDCMCHSFDDVERALCRYIPRMTPELAHAHATEIHTTGAPAWSPLRPKKKLSTT